MTEAPLTGLLRAEIGALHDRIVVLSRELEAARAEGNEAEARRLLAVLKEAQDRSRDADGMAALCDAAVLTDRQAEGWTGLGRCQTALYELLYRHGADGIGALEVVEAQPSQVILVGRITWVDTQSDDLVEATFTFDEDSRAIKGLAVRAGAEGVSADTPPVARRPESDSQWAVVIRAPSG
jgi:hypothetical protein